MNFGKLLRQTGSAPSQVFRRNFGASRIRATTILAVRKGDDMVMIGDGQVSLGDTVMKPNAKKVRRLAGGKVVCGFAGATADAFTLLERLEQKLEQYPDQLLRAGVELAKAWRTEKYLRNLNAVLVVCDKDISLTITGNGDVVEPADGVIGIGSGGIYASSAARALIDMENMTALEIAKKSMTIAADTCVYTNHNFVIEEMSSKEEEPKAEESPKEGAEKVAETKGADSEVKEVPEVVEEVAGKVPETKVA